jgi:hypothetical protein
VTPPPSAATSTSTVTRDVEVERVVIVGDGVDRR